MHDEGKELIINQFSDYFAVRISEIHDPFVGQVFGPPTGHVSGQNVEPLSDALISISVQDPETHEFVPWQAESYGLKNPVTTSADGGYRLLLPAGAYRLLLQKTGYQRLRSSDFNLVNPGFVIFDFTLSPRSGFRGAVEDFIDAVSW